MAFTPIMEGTLSKWTNVMKGWQYRYFVLDDNAGLMSYYTSKEKMVRGVRRGCVRLRSAIIGIDDEDDSTFTITVDGKTFHFQARDAGERERWVRALEDTIARHATRYRWDPNKPPPTIQEFDKKIAEADTYLQVIIDQVQALESRVDKQADPAERHSLQTIVNRANDMLDSIKHTIVLLQIAKNTAHPVNGVYRPPPETPTSGGRLLTPKSPSSPSSPLSPGELFLGSAGVSKEVQAGIELGSECLESRGRAQARPPLPIMPLAGMDDVGVVPLPGPSHRPSMTLVVPERSYSSSEDEDFFDANEDNDSTSSSACSPTGPRAFVDASAEQHTGDVAAPRASISGKLIPRVRGDGSLDYDALYEDDSENDLGSMESHGSVVSHLLSQVKIGMDLTKVVLPTFILERRSLLEMYADYFAHPDMFVSITDFAEPRDRMVQVLRWYVSAYHAGRKSPVAKKPYNPVLGEVFQCHWNMTGPKDSCGTEPVTDGPVPWCSRSQLTFVAEQVSHHPPISAFYAEHYGKKISFCAHVWTKSKFLGLSIGVHNIGQGIISVLDYDEEYIVTFPNGYGRSILTVPWIELGGSVTITCAKSGYVANVEFLTKPFYGGKKNRLSAEVFAPGERKSFLTVQGEWNGLMEAKWADGRTEVFVDVNQTQITKKIVRPIREQMDNESRKVWKEVTAGLSMNNIERATNAKFEIEQRQREEAKERKEKNLKWETKLFKEAGENWIYKSPLGARAPQGNPH
ncbi:oxysterol-binding protein-related protein 9 isoform X2 [Bacillus rossius redtenbacheri]|uniref:oxysterol-binding protein-related protein 9 isoform X2 n=1 Tax=Bacillus rossius redtenbacheri TaxID=93214 RepID=UPI002FDE39F9